MSARFRASMLLAAIAASVALAPTEASADDESGDGGLGWSYLIDGGALPFFWGSALVAVGGLAISPPESPRLFSDSEGGEDFVGDAIPDYQVGILAVAAGGLLALPGRSERFYHLKGIAEAVLTTAAITQLAKVTFGRHRPAYSVGSTSEDDRVSFFSGHSSITTASTTYLGLYLHRNVFPRWRGEGRAVAWWEVLPLTALAATTFYVPYTRVRDNRHHLSDVLVGAGVGASAALGFYVYQELRFLERQRRPSRTSAGIALMPTFDGVTVLGHW